MSTPADLAASARRRAENHARRAGIAEGVAVDPDDVTSEDEFREQHNAAVQAQADEAKAAAEKAEKAAAKKKKD